MMRIYLLLTILLFFSCKKTTHLDSINDTTVINNSKEIIDELNIDLLISNDSTLILKNRNLTELPDLSRYYIKYLDISNNSIDKLEENKLPKKLLTLKANNNQIKQFRLSYHYKTIFDELDFSNNRLDTFDLYPFAKRIILKNNDLVYINFYRKETMFLDISNNKNLSNLVDFQPKGIDTILRENILNSKPLLSRRFTKDGGPIIIKD